VNPPVAGNGIRALAVRFEAIGPFAAILEERFAPPADSRSKPWQTIISIKPDSVDAASN
jgi:hypothetical protein